METRQRGNSKFETHVKPYLEKVSLWVSKGASQAEIAKKLHIGESTLLSYLKKGREGNEPYVELVECFARACEEPDDNVEAALYKSALGYTVDLEKTFKIKKSEFDPVTGKKIAEYEELVKGIDQQHVPANVEAQKFWLANRRRDKWSYKPETGGDSDGEEAGVVILAPVMEKPNPPEESREENE